MIAHSSQRSLDASARRSSLPRRCYRRWRGDDDVIGVLNSRPGCNSAPRVGLACLGGVGAYIRNTDRRGRREYLTADILLIILIPRNASLSRDFTVLREGLCPPLLTGTFTLQRPSPLGTRVAADRSSYEFRRI
jgi:hypothetical protein